MLTSVNKYSGGTTNFSFDDNGNMTGADGESISYNAFNKPLTIQGSAGSSSFSYGANLMRYRQQTPQGTTIYYIDKLMEIETSTSNTDYRHYLGDVAILTKTGDLNDPNPGISYLLRDRLGSVATIADTTGFVIEVRAYDAFGKPRNGDWTDKSQATINSNTTDRGFTDHEHLDDWQLIHMNGRGYDYNLGRFLSIDPIIQSPGNSQSINPYTYIGNNPLSGTDPSGYAGVPEKDKVDGDAAQTKTVTVKTRRSGSRIVTKQQVEVTASNNASGGVDVRLEGGNNGAQLTVASAIGGIGKAIKQHYQGKLDEIASLANRLGTGSQENRVRDGAEYSSTFFSASESGAADEQSERRKRVAVGRNDDTLLSARGRYQSLEDAAYAAADSINRAEDGASGVFNNLSAYAAWITKHRRSFVGEYFYTFTLPVENWSEIYASKPPRAAVGWIRGSGTLSHRNAPPVLGVPNSELYARMAAHGIIGFLVSSDSAIRKFGQSDSADPATRYCVTIRGASAAGC